MPLTCLRMLDLVDWRGHGPRHHWIDCSTTGGRDEGGSNHNHSEWTLRIRGRGSRKASLYGWPMMIWVVDWYARQDSNLRPIAPEAIALSPELRARGDRCDVSATMLIVQHPRASDMRVGARLTERYPARRPPAPHAHDTAQPDARDGAMSRIRPVWWNSRNRRTQGSIS